jgi:alpha/beta hydrolase family protein
MPFIETADRTSLFVTDWGSGPPVVFTHAWGLRSDEFNYQVPALTAAGLRCVLYDRRGHGRSDRPATGYDIDTMADDLAAVIGHSICTRPPLPPTRWGLKKPSAASPATAIPASPGWRSSHRPRRCCAAPPATPTAWTLR